MLIYILKHIIRFFYGIKFLLLVISMEAPRIHRINKILNCDRNANLQVLALQRKQVALWEPESGGTGELQTQQILDMVKDLVNSLFTLLDKRRADTNTRTRWYYRASEKVYGEEVSNLGKISEVVDAYTQLVSTYLSNNTTQTKGIILSSIRRMLGFVSEIRRGRLSIIQLYLDFNADLYQEIHA